MWATPQDLFDKLNKEFGPSVWEKKISNKLLHIVEPKVCGELMFATDLIRALNDYSHYVIFEGFDPNIDNDIIWYTQSAGANVLFADEITTDTIEKEDASGTILYNTKGHKDIGSVIPSIYYSYGVLDLSPNPSIVVPASNYGIDEIIEYKDLYITIPPAINTRLLRYTQKRNKSFSVGLINTGMRNKYPGNFLIEFIGKIDDITFLMTSMNKYDHPGINLAIANYNKKHKMGNCPLKITATPHYLSFCDVLLYCTNENYFEPYSRTVVEAMAMGIPVVCENRGCFPHIFENEKNILLFDSVDEAISQIKRLKEDKGLYNEIKSNALIRSSWEDISLHIGDIKELLKSLGI